MDFRSSEYAGRLRSYEASYRDFSRMVEGKKVSYTIPLLPRWVGVKVIWPFGGAAARAVFFDRAMPTISVSTYLDVNDELGCMDCRPHFEIYPNTDGDTTRFWFEEEAEMYPAIIRSLQKQRRAARKAV